MITKPIDDRTPYWKYFQITYPKASKAYSKIRFDFAKLDAINKQQLISYLINEHIKVLNGNDVKSSTSAYQWWIDQLTDQINVHNKVVRAVETTKHHNVFS